MKRLAARTAGWLRQVIARVIGAKVSRDQVASEEALKDAAEGIADVSRAADGAGRRRMSMLAERAADKVPVEERHADVAEELASIYGEWPARPPASDQSSVSLPTPDRPEPTAHRVQVVHELPDEADVMRMLRRQPQQLPRVEFDQAIRDVQARGAEVAPGWQATADVYTRHGFACAKSMDLAVTKRVQEVIAQTVRGGGPVNPRKVIAGLGDWTQAYADTVYETNVLTAYTAGMWSRLEDEDVARVLLGARFVSALLVTSRPTHVAAHGLVAPTSSTLWNVFSPPMGYRSFLPGTRIAGSVVGGSKASYRGAVVDVETRNGRRLSVTVNHPVLTDAGWQPAGALREGDHLLGYSRKIETLRLAELLVPTPAERSWAVNNQDVIPRIEDVYDALRSRGDLRESILPGVTALDFHGDAAGFYGEVHAVRSDRMLLGHGEEQPQRGCKLDLPLTLRPSSASNGDGAPFAGPPILCSFGAAADRDVKASEAARYASTRDPDFLRDAEHAHPGLIETDRVLHVERRAYDGHVFDLQTVGGWMFAEGIVASNCNCAIREVSMFEARKAGWLDSGGRLLTILPSSFSRARPDAGFGRGRPDRLVASS